MKNNKWNFLVYVHGFLLLWALVFNIHIASNCHGALMRILPFGIIFFLFVNIPLAVLSFVLIGKGRFTNGYKWSVGVLSVLNSAVGIFAWIALSML